MNVNQTKDSKKIYTMIFITLILTVLFSFLGFKECKTIKYSYKENNTVDYKVFLKENKYFDLSYLEKGKTYITSLIDYINADFAYNVDFNNNVTGDIQYQIIAQIKADKDKNEVGNYWTKEYELTEPKTDSIINKKSYSIKTTQKIEYNTYNDLMNEFIKDYNLQTDATLKVALVAKGKVKVETTQQEMEINSETSLTVPLSKLAIEGKIDVSNNNAEKEIVKKVNESEKIKSVYKVLAVIIGLVFLHYLYEAIKREKIINNSLDYRNKVKKIIKQYGSIITHVRGADIDKFAQIKVASFDDLLNVYNNIKEPINFDYEGKKSTFFIINNNSCYVYSIKKED